LTNSTTQQSVLFPDLFDKPLVAVCDQENGSSDGGAILLKAVDKALGLTEAMAGCLRDERQCGKVSHETVELFRQRVFGIACGYTDCNDAARLADDPIHKMVLDRDPIEGDALASQSTLSRFENSAGPLTLYRMGEALFETVLESHRKRLRHRRVDRIVIDLDPTDDPTHGEQQLSLFNGYYDTWCYLPMLGFISFNDEPEQHLFTAILRPGNAAATLGAAGVLRRAIERLIEEFPQARILVRLDGGFACPEIFELLEALPGVDYVAAMASNAVLKRAAEPLMKKARRLSKQTNRTEHVYGECRYAAKTWSKQRRVIIKAEVVRHEGREPKDNPRFVVTNLKRAPRPVYEQVYCERGDVENRIKELKGGMGIDRTSCTRFWANQFRVFMTAAAYVLMQQLRLRADRTSCARAQVQTLRERLLKLGTRVVVSVRRIVVHFPKSYPFFDVWRSMACALGART
jgi:hypothetical protein